MITYKGSLVEVGDYVKAEEAIGLSGKIGRSRCRNYIQRKNKAAMNTAPRLGP